MFIAVLNSFAPFFSFSQEKPYVMEKASKEKTFEGNDRYEGFCVDLLKEIAEKVGFQYVIKLVPDGKYGVPEKDGKWNGMVRELIDRVRLQT